MSPPLGMDSSVPSILFVAVVGGLYESWWHMKHIEHVVVNFHSIQEVLHTCCFFPHVTSWIRLQTSLPRLYAKHHLLENWCFLICRINLRVDVNKGFCYYFVSCYKLYILGVNICLPIHCRILAFLMDLRNICVFIVGWHTYATRREWKPVQLHSLLWQNIQVVFLMFFNFVSCKLHNLVLPDIFACFSVWL